LLKCACTCHRTDVEDKKLEKESGSGFNTNSLAVYYEVCNILFPSLHYSGFPFNPVDKSLLSDILKILQDSLGIDDDNKHR